MKKYWRFEYRKDLDGELNRDWWFEDETFNSLEDLLRHFAYTTCDLNTANGEKIEIDYDKLEFSATYYVTDSGMKTWRKNDTHKMVVTGRAYFYQEDPATASDYEAMEKVMKYVKRKE